MNQAKKLTDLELSAFCGQMALILHAGISASEGIGIMLEDTKEPAERTLLEALQSSMDTEGKSFSEALEETGLYPDYLVRLSRIGEETGKLDEVMQSLSQHYGREDAIRKSIRSAVTYPMVMVVMMIIVILVLLVQVMPIFQQVFAQLGTEMTGFSRMLMDLGTAINRYSIGLTALLALVVAALLWGSRTEQGRRLCRSLGYRLPYTRAIYEEIAACRFAGGMALTLSSGLDSDTGLEMAEGLNEDPDFGKKLSDCRARVEQGEDLTSALHEAGVFTGVYARMAAIGGKTGSMEEAMSRIAGLYQENIDTRLQNGLAVLEPTLVIGISLVVGAILLSVMLPLLGILSGL